MIALYRKLVSLYPGLFRTRNSAEMALLFEEESNRLRDRPASVRLRYDLHVLWDFVLTFQREWRKASPWETKVSFVGTVFVIGLYVAAHAYDQVGELFVLLGAAAGGAWLARRIVGRDRGAQIRASVVLAGTFFAIPWVLAHVASAMPPGSDLIDLGRILILPVGIVNITDTIRNAPWRTPIGAAPRSHIKWYRPSQMLPLLGIAAAIAGIFFFDRGAIVYTSSLLGFPLFLSIQVSARIFVLWKDPEHFTKLPTYAYPAGRQRR